MESASYGDGPCAGELLAVIAAGAIHVVTELTISPAMARFVNSGLAIACGIYVAWRIRQRPSLLRDWGLRGDNFWTALRAHLTFAVAGVLVLGVLGAARGSLAIPATF